MRAERRDQRWLLAIGCVLNAWATYEMSTVTLGMDYWGLAWPRFVQGFGVGLIFAPLNTVALATVEREKMGNATALLNVVRNLGGGIGIALMATLIAPTPISGKPLRSLPKCSLLCRATAR